MSRFVCVDTSVFVKLLVPEEDSDKAAALLKKVNREAQIIVLPSFAWAEVGSVLRKTTRRGGLTKDEAEGLWLRFSQLRGLEYLGGKAIMERAWQISCSHDLPTLYDAAFLAVAEVVAETTGEACELWTADEHLVNSLHGGRHYVRLLQLYAGEADSTPLPRPGG